MKNLYLLLVVGMAAATAYRSQRPALALPASPRVQVAALPVPDSVRPAQFPARPKPSVVRAGPCPAALSRLAQSRAIRRLASPMHTARTSRWKEPGSISAPATRRYDPRPMYFLSLATWVTAGATVLLGLLIAGILTSPLALAILLGLLALPIIAIDVVAIILLREALNDLAEFKRRRQH